MKRKTQRPRTGFKAGDRVEIVRQDISWKPRKKQRYGYITRIDGAYYYVRPRWWKKDEVLELYDVEIRPAPLKKKG